MKSIPGLGRLPKTDEQSAKAWLAGKLFVGPLVGRMITEADSISLGDTASTRRRSRWRGVEFLYRQAGEVFAQWPRIRSQLSEPNRRRPRYPYLG